jgi:hypothetical protein
MCCCACRIYPVQGAVKVTATLTLVAVSFVVEYHYQFKDEPKNALKLCDTEEQCEAVSCADGLHATFRCLLMLQLRKGTGTMMCHMHRLGVLRITQCNVDATKWLRYYLQ